MSDKQHDKTLTETHTAHVTDPHTDHLDDQEKILDGHHDVNYPAVLTRDAPGG